MSVADSLLPPSSKIASKTSVTFARSSSEITLLSDAGASFLFFAREEYVEEAWPIVDPVLRADTQSMNMSRTRGERAKRIKKSRAPSRIPS
jgi:hypothetical protein